MGSTDFSIPPMRSIIDSGTHELVALFCSPPKRSGRGMHIKKNPTHECALAYNIPTYTPKTLKTPEIIKLIHKIKAEIIVVSSYGLILPKEILNCKRYGCINIHPSQLPKYRGPSPIQATIMNHEKQTAVCIIKMEEKVDTGDIILQEIFNISEKIDFPSLSQECAQRGAKLLLKTLDNISILTPIPQNIEATYTKKYTKKNISIEWNKETAFSIDAKIRALKPKIYFGISYKNKSIKIIHSKPLAIKSNHLPGTVFVDITISKNLLVSTPNGLLEIIELQPENKNIISAQSFLNGLKN